jgi:hypothetical protein
LELINYEKIVQHHKWKEFMHKNLIPLSEMDLNNSWTCHLEMLQVYKMNLMTNGKVEKLKMHLVA